MVECCAVRKLGFDHICCAEVFCCCACGAPDKEGNSLMSRILSLNPQAVGSYLDLARVVA